jgi:hypothetical protein
MTLIRPFPSRRRPPSARGLALRALTDFGKTEKHDE